jgi:hypothetical protein
MDERYSTLIGVSYRINGGICGIIEDDPAKGQRYTHFFMTGKKIKIHETKHNKDNTIVKKVEILQ